MTRPTRLVLLLLGPEGDAPDLAPWQEQLAGSSYAGSPLAPELRSVPRPLDDEGWAPRLVEELGLAEFDLVAVADAPSAPGPAAVARLLAAHDRPGTVVDGRALPFEPRHRDEDETPCSAALTLLDARTFAEVGDAWTVPLEKAGRRLLALTVRAGARLRPEAAATVVRRVRLDREGRPLPARPVDATPVPAPRPSGSLHPALLPGSALHAFLGTAGVDPAPLVPESATAPVDRPFLSVVTRTVGTRLRTLEDVLACLAAQTDRDFELLLVCHRAEPDAVAAVRGLLEDQPGWLRERARVLEVERPGRAAPLNDGFAAARGRYVVMLDDDDTVLEHWVETFHRAEAEAEGRMLRAVALLQPVRRDPAHDEPLPCPVEPARLEWPWEFDAADHLRGNHTPCMTVAFPRGLFDPLALRFDETLDTTEDWDMVVRAACVVGVHSVPELTSVYRWWDAGSSREAHAEEEWDEAKARILARLDDLELLVPGSAFAGARAAIEAARAEAHQHREHAQQVATQLHEANLGLTRLHEENEQLRARLRAADGKLRQVRARLALVREKRDALKEQVERAR
ncbi:glycosyltransferase family A protein [Nocardioides solisilvae]|uniref:glycosyltransferase family A protein n=1 Tax=Nocardioides solisilvae TaxID=1542435 RepID=UPI000D74F127|nr:glycosyltransferase family A protein [Nocardioides solisilvae]